MLRRGYLLIEMLIVLTVGSVLMGVAVGVLHLLLRTEQTGRNRAPQATIVARLAEQFRNDANDAVRQVSDAGKSQWQFVLPDNRVVTYQTQSNAVEWSESAVEKTVRRESYVLPSDWSAAIAMHDTAKPPQATLVISERSGIDKAEREVRIKAVLGRNHRFTMPLAGGR